MAPEGAAGRKLTIPRPHPKEFRDDVLAVAPKGDEARDAGQRRCADAPTGWNRRVASSVHMEVPVDTRQLRYFLAIVDHGGFVRAAEHLIIAQP